MCCLSKKTDDLIHYFIVYDYFEIWHIAFCWYIYMSLNFVEITVYFYTELVINENALHIYWNKRHKQMHISLINAIILVQGSLQIKCKILYICNSNCSIQSKIQCNGL